MGNSARPCRKVGMSFSDRFLGCSRLKKKKANKQPEKLKLLKPESTLVSEKVFVTERIRTGKDYKAFQLGCYSESC